jgi:hypothetical protein
MVMTKRTACEAWIKYFALFLPILFFEWHMENIRAGIIQLLGAMVKRQYDVSGLCACAEELLGKVATDRHALNPHCHDLLLCAFQESNHD